MTPTWFKHISTATRHDTIWSGRVSIIGQQQQQQQQHPATVVQRALSSTDSCHQQRERLTCSPINWATEGREEGRCGAEDKTVTHETTTSDNSKHPDTQTDSSAHHITASQAPVTHQSTYNFPDIFPIPFYE